MSDQSSHADSPLRPLVLLAIGAVLALGTGAYLAVRHNSVLWLIPAVASIIANACFFALARRRRGRTGAGQPTGRRLAPPAAPVPATSAAGRWVGGANVIGLFGTRVNATFPLAVLELADSSFDLRMRPRLLGRLFGVGPVAGVSSDELEVFPVKTRVVTTGVGFQRSGGDVAYFWTAAPEEVLQALESAGFRVSWEERRFKR